VSDQWSASGAAAFDALGMLVLSSAESLEATLTAVAALGCDAHAGCDMVSLTLVEGGKPRTVATTDAAAVVFDDAQYRSGTGPCVEAMTAQRIVRVDDLLVDPRWEDLAAAAAEAGIRSSLSAPLVVGGATTGGLNYYGRESAAFSPEDEVFSARFSSRAATVVSNATAYWSVEESARQLATALESRALIEQAKGVLIATQGCTAEEAFDILRRTSQRENRKLRTIAAELVQSRIRKAGG